jgi:hypothetical protein
MKSIPYASAVGGIMYVQISTCLDLAFVKGLLSKFQSNSEIKHWKATKKNLHYLKWTMRYMLTYKKIDNLELIGYSDVNFVACANSQEVDIRLYLHTKKTEQNGDHKRTKF